MGFLEERTSELKVGESEFPTEETA
jgi:hypothetical protein